MKLRWLWLLLPICVAGILGFVISRIVSINPTLYVRANLSVLVQISGVIITFLLACWFIVENKTKAARHKANLEVEARFADDRRRFLQRLDHELKNPLTAIQVGLANLEEGRDPKSIESIKSQTQRLNQLVVNLRKLSDLEIRPIDFTVVSLEEILKTAIAMSNADCATKGIKLSLNLPQAPWPLPSVSGDRDLLLLAFFNILDNAVKFCKPGDTIEVRSSEDGKMVVVEVADTGPGIPEEELSQVWEELYRGKGARGIPGSGLGLALVRVIVNRHSGQVNIRSRTEQGTAVIVRLPLSNQ